MSLRLLSLFALGILVVFSGGFYLGSSLDSSSPDLSPSQESPRINPSGMRKDTGLKTENAESTQSDLGSSMPKGKALVTPSESERMRILLRQIRTENNPITRFAALTQAMKDLNPDNLPQALELFESIPFGFENAQDYRMLLYAWSQFDPLGAIDYCKSRASGIGAGFAVSGVLEGWAARDPESAKAWVEDPENSGMAKLHNFGLVRGWAATDLEGANQYVTEMKGGDEVGKLVKILADEYYKRGFGEASSWAEQLKDTKLKEAAFSSLSRGLSRDQPERISSWLESHADQGYAVKAFENLGKRWSETDPEAAINFFSDLPSGKTQEIGVKSVIGNWAKKDPLIAGQWLNNRPAGPELDSALSVYASTVSNEDGGMAMEWAISISQEKLQQQTIRKVGQEWYRQDKEAVDLWLPDSGLSQEMMKSIQTPPKKNWWQQLSQ